MITLTQAYQKNLLTEEGEAFYKKFMDAFLR